MRSSQPSFCTDEMLTMVDGMAHEGAGPVQLRAALVEMFELAYPEARQVVEYWERKGGGF